MSWGYEVLFDVQDLDGLTPLEKQAALDDSGRWKTERTDTRKGRMGYRTRTTKAGPRLEAEIHPIFGKNQETTARKAKKQLTPEKMQRYNDEKARRYLVQLADANFGKGDYAITLTYDGQAPGWKRACMDVRNFIDRVKRRRRARGLPEMKYIYALEDSEAGREKRIHCHMLLQGDLPREELEAIWGKGFANCDTLQPGPEGLEAIARYIYGQNKGGPREKHHRKYSPSKNLKKPKTRVSDTKVTPGKVKHMAGIFETESGEARRIMEKLYPGYEYVRGYSRRSDIIDGVYIRVLMRKKTEVGA